MSGGYTPMDMLYIVGGLALVVGVPFALVFFVKRGVPALGRYVGSLDPRRTMLTLALGVAAALAAYPPWSYTFQVPSGGEVLKPAPRALLFSPPPPEYSSNRNGVALDLKRLSIECLAVAAGAAALAFVFSSKKRS